MGFDFNIGDAIGKAAEAASNAAEKAAEKASEFAESASEAASNAAEHAGEAASSAAEVASGAASTAAEKAEEVREAVASSDAAAAVTGAARTVASVAGDAASHVAEKAGEAADSAAHAVDEGVKAIKERTPEARARRARLAGFKDGIKQGIAIAGTRAYAFMYAYVATVCYFLRCDGEINAEEETWLRDGLHFIKVNAEIPDGVREDLVAIASNETLGFDEVCGYLDGVSLRSLEAIAVDIESAIYADDIVTEEEKAAREEFTEYIKKRSLAIAPRTSLKAEDAIKQAVAEYEGNLDRVTQEFNERTSLQEADAAFLFGATMLQVMRVLIINALTEVEVAGKGNRNEDALHEMQEKVFGKMDGGNVPSSNLYASKGQILSTSGVPYDATRFGEENLGFFKGANHRFATLGHDPALGLIFGTSNILTNTITCTMPTKPFGVGLRIPITCNVAYDALNKNPLISSPTGTIAMLGAASRRVVAEPDAAAMAFLKQITHIGTDLYTPCGIQLPFANIVLDNAHAEKLTSYISTGDVLKVGAQAGMMVLINWLVAALHGSSLIFKDDGASYSSEMYQVRTKKIILLSNTIATGSSVVQAAIFKNPKCLDLGGAAVLVYRLFTDGAFIARLKEEYVNSELASIYDEKAKKYL